MDRSSLLKWLATVMRMAPDKNSCWVGWWHENRASNPGLLTPGLISVARRAARHSVKKFALGMPRLYEPFPRFRQSLALQLAGERQLRRWEKMGSADPLRPKFLFLHVPKTGGISLTEALITQADFSLLNVDAFPRGDNLISRHFSLRYLLENGVIELQRGALVFACVRHPYQRIPSAFSYMQKQGTYFPKSWSFDDFLAHCRRSFLEAGGATSSHFLHAALQTSFLECATNSTELLILKLERLQDDIKLIEQLLSTTLDIPFLNSSQVNPRNLTKRQKEIIWKVWQRDFEEFDYST